MEENAWVAAVLAGNVSAFANIVEKYQHPVFNLVCRMLGNREEAADAAQEVFLRAYSQLTRYDVVHPFGTWLLAIAAHHSIDLLRRRRNEDIGIERAALILDHTLGPEATAIASERRREVRNLLDHLSPAYRAIVVLRYWHDLACEDIARVMHLSVPTVKTRLHRARAMLVQIVDEAQQQPQAPGGHQVALAKDLVSGEPDSALRRGENLAFSADGRFALGNGCLGPKRTPSRMRELPSIWLATRRSFHGAH